MNKVLETLTACSDGRFPPADGVIELVPPVSGAKVAVMAFANHAIVAADVNGAWIEARTSPNDPSISTSPAFLTALADQTHTQWKSFDNLLCGMPLDGAPDMELHKIDDDFVHPRLARSRRYRQDVVAYTTKDRDAILTLGRGVAGRWEVAIEIDPNTRGKGLGARLGMASRQLMPTNEPLFAQIAPGNIASLRMMLRAGFAPVAAEVLML